MIAEIMSEIAYLYYYGFMKRKLSIYYPKEITKFFIQSLMINDSLTNH